MEQVKAPQVAEIKPQWTNGKPDAGTEVKSVVTDDVNLVTKEELNKKVEASEPIKSGQ